MEVIEKVPYESDWAEREIYWISYWREKEPDLTNTATGGQTAPTTKQSPITVARRMDAINENRVARGLEPRKSGEESKVKEVTNAALYKERIRIAEGKPAKGTPEWKAKIAATLKKRFESMTPEQQKALKTQGAKGGGYWTGKKRGPLSEEARAKLSEIHKTRLAKLTPDQRAARISAAQAANWRNQADAR
jgi:hypothetical protein